MRGIYRPGLVSISVLVVDGYKAFFSRKTLWVSLFVIFGSGACLYVPWKGTATQHEKKTAVINKIQMIVTGRHTMGGIIGLQV